MHIVSFHAHPDDAEILAGGTLALLARQGHQITIVTSSPGDCGSDEYGPEEIARIRRQESKDAAALIGAEARCAEFRDLAVFNDDASRRRVTEMLRELQPDIVLTSSVPDYHCDHEATGLLVRDACFAVSAPNYKTGSAAPMKAIPHLYTMDPAEARDREGNLIWPDFIVDVEEVFAVKRDMLACHASQRNWLLRQHGMDDYLLEMEKWTRARGELIRRNFGEGFRQYRAHPWPTTPLLQQALAGVVHVPAR
jgi:N-acetylglucosamine malate deacetylase 1